MANSFKLIPKKDVGTTPVSIVTPIAGQTLTIIGMSLANTTTSTVTANVTINRSSVDYYVVKGAPIAAGGSMIVVGGEQKLVLEFGDTLYVSSSTVTSIDAVTSYLAIA